MDWDSYIASKGLQLASIQRQLDEVDELPKHVGYNTVVDKDALKTEELRRFNGPHNESSNHIFLNHPSLKAAADWIAKYVHRSKIRS